MSFRLCIMDMFSFVMHYCYFVLCVSMIICQFGSNVAEDPVENAIGYSPILDALEEVAVKALFGTREKPGAFDGTVKKSDGVSNNLLCFI